MQKRLRVYETNYSPDGDRKVIEIIQTDDPKYDDGIKYNFAYLQYDPISDRYSKIYSIDNSHGPAHIHVHEREILFVGSWKIALLQFEDWVKTHRNKG